MTRVDSAVVRYADDCNIYVRSERAGQRVMDSVSDFIPRKLKLTVNRDKSAVDRPSRRQFLGFRFTGGKRPKRRIAPKSLQRCKQKLRELTRRTRGINAATVSTPPQRPQRLYHRLKRPLLQHLVHPLLDQGHTRRRRRLGLHVLGEHHLLNRMLETLTIQPTRERLRPLVAAADVALPGWPCRSGNARSC